MSVLSLLCDVYVSQDRDLINASTCLCMFSALLLVFLNQSKQEDRKHLPADHAYTVDLSCILKAYSKSQIF